MSIIGEFKTFVSRGNAIDMAVGIIVGASFTKVINSLVNDVIMPPIGYLTDGGDFSELGIQIKAATDTAPAVIIKYGQFLTVLMDFFIIMAVLFFLVKAVNLLRSKQED